ncbi:inovirus Gp2 family protein [Rhodobacteraceae bacterium CH30]|nr:inovirus Gp2 family protein [Rhodobacteraceae bacterium CH30]
MKKESKMHQAKLNALPFAEDGLCEQIRISQFVKGGDKIVINDVDWLVFDLFDLESNLRCLLDFDGELVSYGLKESFRPDQVEIHPLAKWLVRSLSRGFYDLHESFSSHKFSPLIDLFFSMVRQDYVFANDLFWNVVRNKVDYVETAFHINRFAHELRGMASKSNLAKYTETRRRYIVKNLKSVNVYIDGIFKRYSKVLVLRVDFCYLEQHGGNVTAKSAKVHLRNMLKNHNDKHCFDGMVGYIWKLEFAKETNFHFHFMAFFDGSKHCRDVYLSEKIGEYWQDVTKGLGRYHNCNAYKSRYKYLGLGMVNRNNVSMVGNVKLAAGYFSKMDYYIRLYTGNKERIFGKGELPRTPPRRPGRPPKEKAAPASSDAPPAAKQCLPDATQQQPASVQGDYQQGEQSCQHKAA